MRVAASGGRRSAPELTLLGASGEAVTDDAAPAASCRLETLKKRRDFLAAARARRAGTPALTLQARQRASEETEATIVRVGYTCSKKVGNSVARNRAKRRLRAAARAILPEAGRPGWDYVLIGRPEITAKRPFPDLLADLRSALKRAHGQRTRSS